MTWRLCLHYGSEFHTVTGRSPVDMGSQAEPGNQEKAIVDSSTGKHGKTRRYNDLHFFMAALDFESDNM